LYVLKNVLYRILGDTTLVGNLRLALAKLLSGKKQKPDLLPTGTLCITLLGVDASNELLGTERCEEGGAAGIVASTTRCLPDISKKIRQWFDGTETSSNPEFRAGWSDAVWLVVYLHRVGKFRETFLFPQAASLRTGCQDKLADCLSRMARIRMRAIANTATRDEKSV
jgi:hypothetical protein